MRNAWELPSFSVSHWTVICNRGNIKHIFTLKTLICLIITATEREDRSCTKLAEFGHCVDQVQTVVRVFLDHRIEPQVQFLQILQLVQRKDVLQRRQSVIVQIQCLQHLQTLNALQTSAQQTYNYIYRWFVYSHMSIPVKHLLTLWYVNKLIYKKLL